MTKKTFFAATLLLIGCGLLALFAFTVMSRLKQQNIPPVWTADTQTLDRVQQLIFEADGKTLISVGSDVCKWDVESGKLKDKIPRRGNSWQKYSSDGKYFAYGIHKYSAGKAAFTTVNLHDASTNLLLQTYVLPGETKTRNVSVDEAVFSNQGRLLNINYSVHHQRRKKSKLVATEVFTVWDTHTRKQVMSRSREVTRTTQRGFFQDPFSRLMIASCGFWKPGRLSHSIIPNRKNTHRQKTPKWI